MMHDETISRPATPSIADCIAAASKATGIPVKDLVGDRLGRKIARPRQIAMWVAAEATCASLPVIGRCFNRDHTTIIHGMRRIESLRATDQAVLELSDRVLRIARRPISAATQASRDIDVVAG